MIRNYITSVFRHLIKNKNSTLINVVGLAIGISCSLFLFLLITYWLSFDTFHKNYDRIYRIVLESDGPMGRRDYTPGTPIPLFEAFKNDFPEVENATFITYPHFALMAVEQKGGETNYFPENNIAYLQPNFFQMFDREWRAGDPALALDEPNEVVLSEKIAQKYFGNISSDEVLDKTIVMDKEVSMRITGIIADPPDNTDFPFDFIVSYETVKDRLIENGHWGSISSDDQVYVLLNEGQSPETINARFPQFIEKYYGDLNNNNKAHYLQPLSDIHFNEKFSAYSYNTIGKKLIWTIAALAVFLVLTACVNFINLATAISIKRSREIGIRKVLGGTKLQLIWQFLGETTLITLFATLIAMGLTKLVLLEANPFLELTLDMDLINDRQLHVYLISLIVGVSLLSGLYPAFVQSGFRPVRALKNLITQKGTGGFSLRRSLVVFQFFISQVFIIGTIVIYSQMRYIQTSDLGFDRDAIITVPLPEGNAEKKKAIREELQRISAIENISLAYRNPSSTSISVTDFQLEDSDESYLTQIKLGDKNYIDLYGLELIAGRGLPDKDTIDQVVVNEKLVKDVGFSSAEESLGKFIKLWGNYVPIVGVVKDFHTTSLRDQIEATTIANDMSQYKFVALKILPRSIDRTIKQVEKTWSSLYPEYTFSYQFVDDEIAEFYRGERKMSVVLGTAAMIAVFIGCLGLYGLVTFMTERRIKEIGIRKVLGASIRSILTLFSREFIILIIISFLLACPLAFYFMDIWLQNFTYRIDLEWWHFAGAGLITLLIAWSTVGLQTVKSALVNPTECLKEE